MVKNLKIAQLVSTFPPYRGGMGNVAFYIADYLSQKRYDITVFTPKIDNNDPDIHSYFKIYKLIPQLKYGNSAVVFQLMWLLLTYDVVHFHYPFLGCSTGVLVSKFLKGKKQKLVLHYHMDLVGRSWRSFIYRIYNIIFLPLLMKFSDIILVTSGDYFKNSIIYKYIKKYRTKFKILPNGVNIDYFKPSAKDFSLENRYELNGKKVVLFVGALDSAHYFKGVNYLIKAFEILNREDVKLIIVGDGDLKKVYQDIVFSFGLKNKVIFTGYIPDEELVRYYNLSDIFVLPSIDKSEAFGMVLLEAMSCAKPVIATDLAGVREVVSSKKNGLLVKPKNAMQLAEQINILLNNPSLAENFGKNGREEVEKKYSWETISQNLIEIYLK